MHIKYGYIFNQNYRWNFGSKIFQDEEEQNKLASLEDAIASDPKTLLTDSPTD